MSDEDFVRTVLGKYYSSVVVDNKMIPHYYNPKKNAFSLIKQVQKHGRDKARDTIRDILCLDMEYVTIRVDENTFKKNKIEVIEETILKIKEVVNEDFKHNKK